MELPRTRLRPSLKKSTTKKFIIFSQQEILLIVREMELSGRKIEKFLSFLIFRESSFLKSGTF